MIENIEDYFQKGCGRCKRFDTPSCSALIWRDGLLALRNICLDEGLVETVKWGQPCYMHAGRNIVVFGAFQGDFRLSFFNAALLEDEYEILEKSGPNAQNPSVVRFTELSDVSNLETHLRTYLKKAMTFAEQGIIPEKVATEIVLPDELSDALDADPTLAEAFHGLTPGRQISYVINLNGAKKSETRINRIAKFRGKILAGKGALEY